MSYMVATIKLLAQTAEQQGATLVGVGCLMVFFMILCMDKCKFSKNQKIILMVFLFIFVVLFFFLFFYLYR